MRRSCRDLLAVFFLAALLGSCATTIQEQRADAESLRTAAENYWNLRLTEDYERTYALEDRQDLPPFKDYRNKVSAMMRLKIVAHSIEKVDVEGNEGTVGVEVSVRLPGPQTPVGQFFSDRWTYKDGKWLHVLHK